MSPKELKRGAFYATRFSIAATVGHAHPVRPLLIASLTAFWSLRFGMHIVARTHGSGDDPRYAKMRDEWGVRQYRLKPTVKSS